MLKIKKLHRYMLLTLATIAVVCMILIALGLQTIWHVTLMGIAALFTMWLTEAIGA